MSQWAENSLQRLNVYAVRVPKRRWTRENIWRSNGSNFPVILNCLLLSPQEKKQTSSRTLLTPSMKKVEKKAYQANIAKWH